MTETHAHTHNHAFAWLLAPTHTPLAFTGLIPLHAYSFTLNLCTYFTRVGGVSLSSRNSHIADCAVRYPGVERPFSSIILVYFL